MTDLLMNIAGVIIIAAGLTGSFRFFFGPRLEDRVVAFDVLTIITISLIAFLAHIFMREIYLDVAIVYGLLSFLGVVVVAKFIERGL